VARGDAQRARAAFERSSAEVASTLTPAIQPEDDLGVNAAAFVVVRPDASNTQFR
jgi:hypothetical protein